MTCCRCEVEWLEEVHLPHWSRQVHKVRHQEWAKVRDCQGYLHQDSERPQRWEQVPQDCSKAPNTHCRRQRLLSSRYMSHPLQLPMYNASRDFITLSLDGSRAVEERIQQDGRGTALSILDHYLARPSTPTYSTLTTLHHAQGAGWTA